MFVIRIVYYNEYITGYVLEINPKVTIHNIHQTSVYRAYNTSGITILLQAHHGRLGLV